MLTVNADRDVVERQLGDGELACPSCGGVLARWGKGEERRVRVLDRVGEIRAERMERGEEFLSRYGIRSLSRYHAVPGPAG